MCHLRSMLLPIMSNNMFVVSCPCVDNLYRFYLKRFMLLLAVGSASRAPCLAQQSYGVLSQGCFFTTLCTFLFTFIYSCLVCSSILVHFICGRNSNKVPEMNKRVPQFLLQQLIFLIVRIWVRFNN